MEKDIFDGLGEPVYDANEAPELLGVDYDGDGIIDEYILAGESSDDPGLENQAFAVDYDGDGVIDEIIFGMDTDSDGVMDRLFQAVDLDNDGVANGYMSITNMTEEGYSGNTHIEAAFDLDGDHQMDVFSMAQFDYTGSNGVISFFSDPDGDHIWEAHENYLVEGGMVTPVYMGGCASDTYESFDPSAADMSRVIGHPEDYMDNWHFQETGFSCSVASQEFVIEELLGVSLDEAELRRIAVENGWLGPEGTAPDDTGRLLEHMGLNVRMTFNNTFEDLCACLDRGIHPVVGVDSDELWSGENEELYMPGNDANHSIQVIGVDLQDPENPMVILNDPGVTNGCGAMVPADLFVGAWEDSGCRIVEACLDMG